MSKLQRKNLPTSSQSYFGDIIYLNTCVILAGDINIDIISVLRLLSQVWLN